MKDTGDASAVSTAVSLRICGICGNNRLGIAMKAQSVGGLLRTTWDFL